MRDSRRIDTLLALFTSADRAEAIAGDLVESHAGRGAMWFWSQALTTTAALAMRSLATATGRTLGLAAAGCSLLGTSVLVGFAAIALFPASLGSVGSWIGMAAIGWAGALCAGAVLSAAGQARGMSAAVLAALFAELVVAIGGPMVFPAGILNTRRALFYSLAAAAPLMLLAGGAVVRVRQITASHHNPGLSS